MRSHLLDNFSRARILRALIVVAALTALPVQTATADTCGGKNGPIAAVVAYSHIDLVEGGGVKTLIPPPRVQAFFVNPSPATGGKSSTGSSTNGR